MKKSDWLPYPKYKPKHNTYVLIAHETGMRIPAAGITGSMEIETAMYHGGRFNSADGIIMEPLYWQKIIFPEYPKQKRLKHP